MFKGLKTVFRIFLLALLTVVIGGIIIKLDYDKALKTENSDDTEKVTVIIDEGETTDEILDSLVEDGLLRKSWVNYVKVYLKIKKLATSLQAGTYALPKNLTIIELIESLQNGKNSDVWVTIQEGLRKDQIADKLAEEMDWFSKEKFLELTTDKDFISTLGLIDGLTDLEGYLFPDKYAFAQDTTEEEIIKKMTDNFISKVGLEDSYQDIILASIVEREGRTSEDRAIIAGIIIKRYNEGWTLGLTTTTLYYLKTWDESEVTSEDLADDNAYNTYKNVGYPPTPICNPGLDAIEAMRHPVETEYYYFICDTEGVTHYAETYDEHVANINKYLR